MISQDEVKWGYRFLLGREPENAAAIEYHVQADSWGDLRATLMNSTEFCSRSTATAWPHRWVLAEVFEATRMMWVQLSDRSVSYPVMMNDYEPFETHVAQSLLSSGDHFIDIGANIGWFSVLASRIVGETGTITAFEPRPETFDYLSRSLALTGMGERARPMRFGLADKPGVMNLTWGVDTPNPGGSRLVHGTLPQGQDGVAVELKRLDDLGITACDFIKVDVEGAEMLALRGGALTIARHRPIIMSEVHRTQLADVSRIGAAEYIAELGAMGYTSMVIDAGRRWQSLDGVADSGIADLVNVVFAPVERASEIHATLVASTP